MLVENFTTMQSITEAGPLPSCNVVLWQRPSLGRLLTWQLHISRTCHRITGFLHGHGDGHGTHRGAYDS